MITSHKIYVTISPSFVPSTTFQPKSRRSFRHLPLTIIRLVLLLIILRRLLLLNSSMLHQAPTAPTGPRASRTSGRLASSRIPNRGGIQKLNAAPARLDKDGDLIMGAAGAGSRPGTTGRAGRGRGSLQPSRNGTPDSLISRSSRTSRTGIDPSAIQKAVLRGMGEKAGPKGQRSSTRSVRGRDRSHIVGDGLDRITVKGFQQSKAASNPDGGISDLIAFLERKAAHPNAETVKIKKVCLTLHSARQRRHLKLQIVRSGLVSSQVLRTTTEIPRYSLWVTCNNKVLCLANVV